MPNLCGYGIFELAEMFPDAKILLSVEEVDRIKKERPDLIPYVAPYTTCL